MDKFIRFFLKFANKKISVNNLPVLVHKKNIKYFKVLNYNNEINIFDLLSIEIKLYNEKIFIKENKSNIKEFSKGSIILKINNLHPLSQIKKCNILDIEIKQKIKNRFIYKNIKVISPKFNCKKKSYNIKTYKSYTYIKIYSFYKNQFKDFNLKSNNNIILDLRNNSGGNFSDMIDFLEIFFKEKEKIMNLEVLGDKYLVNSKNSTYISFNKIYIIVNNNTYSCAEILSNILKEKLGAKIIGKKTAGKISITKVYEINNINFVVPIGKYIQKSDLDILYISDKTIDKWLSKKVNINLS